MNLGQSVAKQNKLQPVIKLKQRREQQAGRRLQETNLDRQRHHQLIKQLQDYRDGYLQKMEGVLKQGVAVNQLGDYRAMLAELDEALTKERAALQWAENDWQQAHEVWQVARSQVEALSGLSKQYARDGRRAAETLEQDQQEDIHRNQSR
ncbi:MAG: hypothetical protein DRQ60_04070 [Gammaproteobacteria bacterium]|nr:MAG: hypothetical protein DRQ60_04070 [Gammaproteobacteria bacterium]